MNSDCVLNESDIDDRSNESDNGSCTYVYSKDHSYQSYPPVKKQ